MAALRLGPRPLPLHLASAATLWLSSRAALPLLSSGLLPWKPELAAAGNALRQSLAGVAAEDFATAVEGELRARSDSFLQGLERYRHHPYRRAASEPPVLWQEGATRLLDYRPAGGPPVLVVPSLINRAYILDLLPDRSLLRFLAAAGLRPLLVDWGKPEALERSFDLTHYVAGRLERAAEVTASLGAPFAVIGYCMGGLLALALAERRGGLVSALALLASPWDFHAERPGQARLLGEIAEPLVRSFALLGEVPVDMLQLLFATLDPLLALRKFSRFAALPAGSAEERDFVAVEDWLNDGVPLALPVARECLGGWYGANTPEAGLWRIAGRPVLPERVAAPSLVIVPAQDRIVPPRTAAALARRLPRAEELTPPLGHIGMMVAHEAPTAVWRPLADWLGRPAAAPARPPRRRRRD
ncbi:MAG TPA: alpha/beta fold hydrolase [Stellaceae bacterium]|nr:alpha/beta fold hydrolase [Stellaceae bacterium]